MTKGRFEKMIWIMKLNLNLFIVLEMEMSRMTNINSWVQLIY